MSQTTAEQIRGAKANRWGAWVAVALVATLAGLLLPQMMPGDTLVPQTSAEPSAKTNGGRVSKDKKNLAYSAPAVPEAPHFQGMLLRLGAGTIVVLGLCVATLWGMKRWMQPHLQADSAEREMRLKETLNLGNRCSVHLVHLGKREVLIGVDATGIKALLQLPGTFDETFADAENAASLGEPKPTLPLASRVA